MIHQTFQSNLINFLSENACWGFTFVEQYYTLIFHFLALEQSLQKFSKTLSKCKQYPRKKREKSLFSKVFKNSQICEVWPLTFVRFWRFLKRSSDKHESERQSALLKKFSKKHGRSLSCLSDERFKKRQNRT